MVWRLLQLVVLLRAPRSLHSSSSRSADMSKRRVKNLCETVRPR